MPASVEDLRPCARRPGHPIMSPYANRLALAEGALKAEHVHPAKGKTLADAAVTVLAAIDHIRENVR